MDKAIDSHCVSRKKLKQFLIEIQKNWSKWKKFENGTLYRASSLVNQKHFFHCLSVKNPKTIGKHKRELRTFSMGFFSKLEKVVRIDKEN